MKGIQEIRRALIMARKRVELFRYNFNFKRQQGGFVDMAADIDSYKTARVLNVADFGSRREAYLLEVRSDATDFGGQSEAILEHHPQEGFMRMQAKFIRESATLQLQTDVMFCGWENLYLPKTHYEMCNGIRVTMRPPAYPCKFGLHIKVSIGNDFEQFVGHILDTENPDPHSWQQYELPVCLLHQDYVPGKIQNPPILDHFVCHGLTFRTESDQETTSEAVRPHVFDIKSVDIIYNPEYEQILGKYRLPVFFKSNLDEPDRKTYAEQGELDNGRHIVPLEDPQASSSSSQQRQRRFARTEEPRQAQSIADRLKNKK